MSSYYSDKLSVKTAELLFRSNPEAALPWVGSILGALIGGGVLLIVGLGYAKLRKEKASAWET